MNLFRKTYEIYGMVEKSCVFKIGSGFIRADFKQGSLATSGVIPASFTTEDRVVQCAIEASDKYKSGVVKIGKMIKIGELPDAEKKDAPPMVPATGPEGKGGCEGEGEGKPTGSIDYPDVTTGQAARAILSVEPYSVSVARLQRNDEIKVVALGLGVSFSNWK